ncbi:hypothetical protein CB0940_03034 [Cercospora beticola]|uniref:Uncharacterized protein n=1 Tax=Cercospora beticola TaxID=122368 RepID=A0A2G5I448_CERBT|nr:hypothetical protein CB0940_03034 [Cercospora beticola]PIA99521.1 hypothetical protein CB0940_03034 [Cercospora beticola]
MLSLAGTNLSLRHLNLFHNYFSGHCSLECNELSFCDWQADGVAFTLASLESLSISISDRILHETRHDRTATGDPVELINADEFQDLLPIREELIDQGWAPECYTGLIELLNSCKQLLQFNFRRCFIRTRAPGLHDHEGFKFLQHISSRAPLPNLQICSLGNFVVYERDLLTFLKHSPLLRSLTLHNFGLQHGGAWDNVFKLFTDEHTLHFEDLYQGDRLILFDNGHDNTCEDCLADGLNMGQRTYRRATGQSDAITWHIPDPLLSRPHHCVERRNEQQRDQFGPPVSYYPGLHN